MKSIALGQYYPANSFLHKADPRIKIILALLYIVCSFMCKNIFSFALLAISAIVVIIVGKIPLKIIFRGLKPIVVILIITSLFNILWTSGERLLLDFWIFNIYLEGIFAAIFMVVRITALIIGTSVFLTYTTTPIDLTDGIEDILSPLKKLHVPVHEFAMMMTIALRFIPTLVEETEKIMTAQKARGVDFTTGSLISRVKSLIPILIPLFVSAFNRASDLATAMECRCYHGGEGRTRMKVRKLRFSDFVPLFIIVMFGAALIFLNVKGWVFTM